MKKVVVFAGSNSKESINKKLATYTSSLLENVSINILDLNDFELPIYSIDEEVKNGIPKKAQMFFNEIQNSNGIIISLAEHNGNFTAVFKNLYDWMSRIEQKLWSNKPMLVMAASPGGRGGKSVLEIAQNSFPRMGADVTGVFSLPSFYENFKENTIQNKELLVMLKKELNNFTKKLM